MNSLSPKDSLIAGNSHDEILNGKQSQQDVENSYLLTEMESVSSRVQSPNTSTLNSASSFR